MKSIGIDIGSHSIKLVEIQTTNKGHIITRAREQFLSLKTNQDQDLEIIEILRELVKNEDPGQVRFCLGMPQERVILRHKLFPFKDRLKISKSLPFELEEDIPMSSDNAIFDAKIILTRGETAEVLAAAVTKSSIAQLLSKIEDAGIQPSILSAEGMALSNVFENWNDAPPQYPPLVTLGEEIIEARRLKIILQIGFSKTMVMAFEKDRLIALRTILWGGKQITEAISRKYELPFMEAKKELELKGFILPSKNNASYDAKIFSDTISKTVRELVRDLQLSFLEIKTEFQAEVTDVYMTGGMSTLRGLGAFLTLNLDLPVNVVTIYNRFPQIIFNVAEYPDQRFGTALGLALEGIKKPRNPALQFLRNEFAQSNNRLAQLTQFWGRTLVVSSAFLLMLIVYGYLRDSLSLEADALAEENLRTQAVQVAKIPARSATEGGIQRYIRDTRKRVSEVRALSGVIQMNSAMDVLKRVTESAPGKDRITLDLHTFRVRDNNVEMQGYVNSENEINILQNELRRIASDGKISTSPAQIPARAGKTSFSVLFKADRNLQATSRE